MPVPPIPYLHYFHDSAASALFVLHACPLSSSSSREVIARAGGDRLWRFVESWVALAEQGRNGSLTEADCVGRILACAGTLLGDQLTTLVGLSLRLRTESVALVPYRQLARQSLARAGLLASPVQGDLDRWTVSVEPPAAEGRHCCWVDVGASAHLYTPTDVSAWLATLMSRELPGWQEEESLGATTVGHVYPGGEAAASVAVLYGALGSACFAPLHRPLAEAAKKGSLRYIYRPLLPVGCQRSAETCTALGIDSVVTLPGYGVELALKNMEYKAMDDSHDRAGGAGSSESTEDNLMEDVKGFNFQQLLERKAHLTAELLTFRDHLMSIDDISEKVNVWDIKDLGLQASQRIAVAADPLQLMQEMNQNFPNLVSSLSRTKLNRTIADEIGQNQRMMMAGRNLLALNGALLSLDSLDLFSLLELLRQELTVAEDLKKLQLPAEVVKRLMLLPGAGENRSPRIDHRLHDQHIHYLNNIEADARYRTWRTALNELLMPAYAGQIRAVRKNLFHAIYIIDPATPAGLQVVEAIMDQFQRFLPVRSAVMLAATDVLRQMEQHGSDLVPVAEPSPSDMVIRAFLYLRDNFEMRAAFDFLINIGQLQEEVYSDESFEDPVAYTVVESAFAKAMGSQRARYSEDQALEVLRDLGESEAYAALAANSSAAVFKLGLSRSLPCLLFNGILTTSAGVLEGAVDGIGDEMPKVQEAVYYGRLTTRTDALSFFLDDSAVTRYNAKILGADGSKEVYVSLVDTLQHPTMAELPYLHTADSMWQHSPTHLPCSSLQRPSGSWLEDGSEEAMQSRVAVLHNAPRQEQGHASLNDTLVARVVVAALRLPSRRAKLVPFLRSLLSSPGVASLTPEAALELAHDFGLQEKSLQSLLSEWESATQSMMELMDIVRSTLKVAPGQNGLITNGRVLLVDPDELQAEDLQLMGRMELEKKARSVQEIIQNASWQELEPDVLTRQATVCPDFLSTAIMGAASASSTSIKSSQTARFSMLAVEHSGIIREEPGSVLSIDAVLDPLSTEAQRLVPLLLLTQSYFRPSLRVVLNPSANLADMPLKNFYRAAVPSKVEPWADGMLDLGTQVTFARLPQSRLLTLNVHTPEAWLVESTIAVYDLDNIILEKVPSGSLSATFELEALVITGRGSGSKAWPDSAFALLLVLSKPYALLLPKEHGGAGDCYEVGDRGSQEPPRGLQLRLGVKDELHLVDTIVMANLGYFQLKAAPGLWLLSLAPGRSTELYELVGGQEGSLQSIHLATLRRVDVHLHVRKRPGYEVEELLQDESAPVASEAGEAEAADSGQAAGSDGEARSLWGSVFNAFASGKPALATQDLSSTPQASNLAEVGDFGRGVTRTGGTVNIFSIASGHLYERFTRIMILSVLSHTRRPVKFWFIKNYLAPQFKDVLPLMAREYGFEFELVTYKWPSWLHKQTEKQRLIWAYKILFLDVLFPLSLKKVIFCDADQIIRVDMGVLYDMDLHGCPFAYTPMCDNNKEMDGYRFWKQGFWKDHLQGKPYHISALYVVDLVKFRSMAAGDRLRVFYESLSRDPNSLANLDQDLPNYAQHVVPIHSLPQEWLWCESWCGNETKSTAKTIDLCNNPMTKEPKLEGARRIVAEWTTLDEEQRRFVERVLGQGGGEAGEESGSAARLAEDVEAEAELEREARAAAEEAERGRGASGGRTEL
eukprot:SM000007S20802  [mRNA]  locus=s7:271985:281468:- [translate_table: standard]